MKRLPCSLTVVLALVVPGCHRTASIFSPAGPSSRSIASLGVWMTAGFGAVSLVMTAIIVVAATRTRGTLDVHAPVDTAGGQRWIFFGGFLLPSLVFGGLFVATLRLVDRFPLHDGGHYRPDIRVTGRQWWWEVEYLGGPPNAHVTTANEIHIPVGWPAEVELVSRDVIHSLWIPALNGKVDLVPGVTNHLRLDADVPGRYDGQCAEYCGVQHALMKLAVVVEPLDEYERWLAHEASPAVTPSSAEATEGKKIFEEGACATCHAIRGTRAMARTGPDLTHVARRWGLAAYAIPNSRAYLEAWITHAQSLKPGAQMPDLTQFSGEQLQALTRYLEQLE